MKTRSSSLTLSVVALCLFGHAFGLVVHARAVPSPRAPAATETQIRYLSGTGADDAVPWDFYCTEGRRCGVWTKIAVPSCWEQQGFGGYNFGRPFGPANPLAKEQGMYRYQFNVPAEWKGKVVRLVFDGVMTDAEVWVNGQSAGPVHQGSFYRFKHDITPRLKFGATNTLEVTVSKISANESVNRAERFGSDYWVFGGIFRPVFLEALPASFIDWTGIDARADGSFDMDAHLGAEATEAGEVTAQILDAQGRAVGKPFGASFAPRQTTVRLRTKIAAPKQWTAETPNLYRVRLTLSQGARPAHTVIERFGFRTFEVRAGDGLYLNGRKITLKGANRHSFWPETGRTLSRKINYDDARLIKEMNNNAVRMSHYPPDAEFLAACDELGLYVLDELGGWQRSYDTPTGRRLIGEMIRRDVNHPSILFWDNGNEGGWNRDNDDEFAKWDIQQRHVLHPWELFRGVNTDHYEKYDSHVRLSAGPDIFMSTEYLHGLYDGGIGAGMFDYWEVTRRSPSRAGGFLWALVDECVARTDQGGQLDCSGNQGPDGIVGPRREREGSFDTVREIWSPVQVTPTADQQGVQRQGVPPTTVDALRGAFTVENRYDFTNLDECRFDWRLARFPSPTTGKAGHVTAASGTVKGPNVPPQATGELKLNLPPSARRADALYVTAKDPAGRELWTWSWGLKRAAEATTGNITREAARTNAGEVLTRDEGGALVVSAGTLELRFDKASGRLAAVRRGGKPLAFGDGPRFLAFRRDGRKFQDITGTSALTNFSSRKEGADVIVEASYAGALQRTRWRVSHGGAARLEYEYSFDGVVDMIGVRFDYPEKQMRGMRWLGWGPFRVWQNRMHGVRLDVWEKAYNDTTPGESWLYPEFKGYHRDWRWASFDTTEGRLTFINEAGDTFLGVYRPKEGQNGPLEMPETGLALLDVIPAMGSKFQAPDELGPQSQPRRIAGTTRRAVHFHFHD